MTIFENYKFKFLCNILFGAYTFYNRLRHHGLFGRSHLHKPRKKIPPASTGTIKEALWLSTCRSLCPRLLTSNTIWLLLRWAQWETVSEIYCPIYCHRIFIKYVFAVGMQNPNVIVVDTGKLMDEETPNHNYANNHNGVWQQTNGTLKHPNMGNGGENFSLVSFTFL